MADTTKNDTNKTTSTTPSATSQALDKTRRSDKQELGRFGYDSPFSFMRRFVNDIDALFGGYGNYGFAAPQLWMPQIDVLEKDNQLMLHADLPGTREEDIKIRIDDGVLTVSGERTNELGQDENGVHRRERSFGSFSRSIVLPEGVDPEAVQASFDNGVLEVTVPLPKGKATTGHAVPIRAKTNDVKH